MMLWGGFLLLITGLLTLDLAVLNRRPHAISPREAIGWTAFWVSLALLFNVAIYFIYSGGILGAGPELGGREAALQFLTAYLVEESLSLDNVFVIAIVIQFFRIPPAFQHRVLFWGIAGALVMRGTMILIGIAAIRRMEWLVYPFGLILLATAVRMLLMKEEGIDPGRNLAVRIFRRFWPATATIDGSSFFTREGGRRVATPLFVALIVIESADLLFAVDSIPAVLAITRDPFVAFTSNAFAILGLRSLYFALAAVLGRFHYLKISLVFVLGFVGIKMMLSRHIHIPVGLSLAVIAAMLGAGVAASLLRDRRKVRDQPEECLSEPPPAVNS